MDVRAASQPINPHPQRGNPTFVPWLGYEDRFLLEQIDRAGLHLTAKSRLHEATNGQIALLTRSRGMGLALAPENWRNQLGPGAHHRPQSFAALGHSLRTAFDPNRDRFDRHALVGYSHATVDSQIDRRATLIATPGHVVDDEAVLGRSTDLQLAEAASNYFFEQRLDEPAPGDEHSLARVLYATIIVTPKDLTQAIIWKLIRSYAELRVDGYWVWVNGLDFTGPQARNAALLCLGLEAETDRPVMLSGARHLHMAFLAAGLAATSVGPAEATRFVYPPAAPPAPDEQGGRPRRLPVFHGKTLYSFGPRKQGKWAGLLREAFETYECDCGHHEPTRSPSNNAETKRHTTALNLRHAGELSVSADPQSWLDLKLAAAQEARRRLGLRQLEPGWRNVGSVPAEIAAAGSVLNALTA